MKFLIAVIVMCTSLVASAQHDDLYYFKKRLEKQKQEKILPQIQSPVLLPHKSNNAIARTKEYNLPGGEKVTILVQDINMPNAGTMDMLKKNIAAIPNPSQSLKISKSFSSVEP
jgi:hypothetical protein